MIENNPQKTFDQIVLEMFYLYKDEINIILQDIPEIMKNYRNYSCKYLYRYKGNPKGVPLWD